MKRSAVSNLRNPTRLFAIGMAATLCLMAVAIGQSTKPADVIAMRQSQFREIGTAFKAINDELKKDAPVKYVVSSSASQIVTGLRNSARLFTAGTGPGPRLKTKARGEIWSNSATFDRLFADASVQATKLVALSRSGDFAAVGVQAKILGGACQSCHKQFREQE